MIDIAMGSTWQTMVLSERKVSPEGKHQMVYAPMYIHPDAPMFKGLDLETQVAIADYFRMLFEIGLLALDAAKTYKEAKGEW